MIDLQLLVLYMACKRLATRDPVAISKALWHHSERLAFSTRGEELMDIADRPRQSVPGNGLEVDVCGKVFGRGWPNLGDRLSFVGHVLQEATFLMEHMAI